MLIRRLGHAVKRINQTIPSDIQAEALKENMQQDKLRELAVVLTETIRQNASIDWTLKESVKAKLKVAVKRLLLQ